MNDDDFTFSLDESELSFTVPGLQVDETAEDQEQQEKIGGAPEGEKPSIKVSHRYGHRHLSRKAKSEEALSKALDWYFKPGDCYHCFSFGDVDALTYLKHVLRQERVLYLALSTWCMAGEDVDDLREWHRRGMLGRVDFYMGEIFPGSYPEVYDAVVDFVAECGGRLTVFRNHSKIMAVVGERFDVLIESSANVNTNPRSENTVLTVDSDLVAHYVELLNGINSFDRTTDGVALYQIPERRGPAWIAGNG